MTRKTIHFSKGFLPCAVISAAIIVSGMMVGAIGSTISLKRFLKV